MVAEGSERSRCVLSGASQGEQAEGNPADPHVSISTAVRGKKPAPFRWSTDSNRSGSAGDSQEESFQRGALDPQDLSSGLDLYLLPLILSLWRILLYYLIFSFLLLACLHVNPRRSFLRCRRTGRRK
jgi:hypothetical protein